MSKTLLFAASLAVVGCHNLYPEDVTSLHAADQQLLQAYGSSDPTIVQAHVRAAFCNEEAVERRHSAGQVVQTTIVCQVERK